MSKSKQETKAPTWQDDFTLIAPLVEKHVIAFELAQANIPYLRLLGTNSYYEAYLCAAIEANWIEAPKTSIEKIELTENGEGPKIETRYFYDGINIDEMHAGAVRWLGTAVREAYDKATEVPLELC